ncbi:uncharacterized protein LOC142348143 isoform X2 [Convolutriloba macropyga]|uniref:uncharacterized protein LOC142348143 isoform X2 n=1 Tax=Convolutriloba macropyga TaxID=536237 RepID=UPI003F52549A
MYQKQCDAKRAAKQAEVASTGSKTSKQNPSVNKSSRGQPDTMTDGATSSSTQQYEQVGSNPAASDAFSVATISMSIATDFDNTGLTEDDPNRKRSYKRSIVLNVTSKPRITLHTMEPFHPDSQQPQVSIVSPEVLARMMEICARDMPVTDYGIQGELMKSLQDSQVATSELTNNDDGTLTQTQTRQLDAGQQTFTLESSVTLSRDKVMANGGQSENPTNQQARILQNILEALPESIVSSDASALKPGSAVQNKSSENRDETYEIQSGVPNTQSSKAVVSSSAKGIMKKESAGSQNTKTATESKGAADTNSTNSSKKSKDRTAKSNRVFTSSQLSHTHRTDEPKEQDLMSASKREPSTATASSRRISFDNESMKLKPDFPISEVKSAQTAPKSNSEKMSKSNESHNSDGKSVQSDQSRALHQSKVTEAYQVARVKKPKILKAPEEKLDVPSDVVVAGSGNQVSRSESKDTSSRGGKSSRETETKAKYEEPAIQVTNADHTSKKSTKSRTSQSSKQSGSTKTFSESSASNEANTKKNEALNDKSEKSAKSQDTESKKSKKKEQQYPTVISETIATNEVRAKNQDSTENFEKSETTQTIEVSSTAYEPMNTTRKTNIYEMLPKTEANIENNSLLKSRPDTVVKVTSETTSRTGETIDVTSTSKGLKSHKGSKSARSETTALYTILKKGEVKKSSGSKSSRSKVYQSVMMPSIMSSDSENPQERSKVDKEVMMPSVLGSDSETAQQSDVQFCQQSPLLDQTPIKLPSEPKSKKSRSSLKSKSSNGSRKNRLNSARSAGSSATGDTNFIVRSSTRHLGGSEVLSSVHDRTNDTKTSSKEIKGAVHLSSAESDLKLRVEKEDSGVLTRESLRTSEISGQSGAGAETLNKSSNRRTSTREDLLEPNQTANSQRNQTKSSSTIDYISIDKNDSSYHVRTIDETTTDDSSRRSSRKRGRPKLDSNRIPEDETVATMEKSYVQSADIKTTELENDTISRKSKKSRRQSVSKQKPDDQKDESPELIVAWPYVALHNKSEQKKEEQSAISQSHVSEIGSQTNDNGTTKDYVKSPAVSIHTNNDDFVTAGEVSPTQFYRQFQRKSLEDNPSITVMQSKRADTKSTRNSDYVTAPDVQDERHTYDVIDCQPSAADLCSGKSYSERITASDLKSGKSCTIVITPSESQNQFSDMTDSREPPAIPPRVPLQRSREGSDILSGRSSGRKSSRKSSLKRSIKALDVNERSNLSSEFVRTAGPGGSVSSTLLTPTHTCMRSDLSSKMITEQPTVTREGSHLGVNNHYEEIAESTRKELMSARAVSENEYSRSHIDSERGTTQMATMRTDASSKRSSKNFVHSVSVSQPPSVFNQSICEESDQSQDFDGNAEPQSDVRESIDRGGEPASTRAIVTSTEGSRTTKLEICSQEINKATSRSTPLSDRSFNDQSSLKPPSSKADSCRTSKRSSRRSSRTLSHPVSISQPPTVFNQSQSADSMQSQACVRTVDTIVELPPESGSKKRSSKHSKEMNSKGASSIPTDSTNRHYLPRHELSASRDASSSKSTTEGVHTLLMVGEMGESVHSSVVEDISRPDLENDGILRPILSPRGKRLKLQEQNSDDYSKTEWISDVGNSTTWQDDSTTIHQTSTDNSGVQLHPGNKYLNQYSLSPVPNTRPITHSGFSDANSRLSASPSNVKPVSWNDGSPAAVSKSFLTPVKARQSAQPDRSVRDDLESCLGSAMFEPSATVVNDSTFSPVGADTRSRTSDSKAPEKKGEMPLFPHSDGEKSWSGQGPPSYTDKDNEQRENCESLYGTLGAKTSLDRGQTLPQVEAGTESRTQATGKPHSSMQTGQQVELRIQKEDTDQDDDAKSYSSSKNRDGGSKKKKKSKKSKSSKELFL